jgi:hypothetical protein
MMKEVFTVPTPKSVKELFTLWRPKTVKGACKTVKRPFTRILRL